MEQYLKDLKKAHYRGYSSALDKGSREYHRGAYNTINHVLGELKRDETRKK
ncbi:hypothetical protein LCGC14_2338830 [marine sediment metagenome]|uniref:Uncharacterized protein n=1 Tax=marine sediment metagenome TaxID=412755 RepID=A0A0F9CDF2_9ZZZZ